MISIQTLYLFVTVIVLIMLLSLILKLHEIYKTRKHVKTLWDRQVPFSGAKLPFVHYHNYFVNIMENEETDDRNIVDDETWSDLDLGQLIEKINFTFTTIGDELLYASLRNAPENGTVDETLIGRIQDDRTFRENFSFRLAMLGKSKNSNTSKFMYAFKPQQKYKPLYLLLTFLPFIGVLLFFIDPFLSIMTILAGLGVNAYLSQKHKGATGFDYTDIFYAINIIVTAGKLDAKYNSRGLKRLSFLSPLFVIDDTSGEMNIGAQVFSAMKLMFLVDYHLYHLILKSLNRNHRLYKASWHYVAELDLNYSVAMWRETLPYYAAPEMTYDSYIKAEDLYHPLVTDPVENDLNFDKDILLTGSNAAGKSTFMKALGVNVVLSNGLNTSTSSLFKYRPGKVISSMDITDSVIEGDSYFISEIKSLKRIIEEIEHFEGSIYCIIDEVFKGTNTIERVAAAETLLRYLNDRKNVHLIAATHDMELTELLAGELAFYHFREHLTGDDIYFEYKIREGVASTSNAIELLRLYEFPGEVYREAKSKISN
ncbi:MutS-related protein [Salinicoccus sp. HZC-1]|uniref:MutS-related protein n=1 Tax=Salinicoccus sp. HZC-1 TaxID=3385497 RepID=UPI00398AAE92